MLSLLVFHLLNELETVVFVASVGPLLLVLELDRVLAVLSEELADAPEVVAVELVVVGETQELGQVCFRLPLHHLEQMGQGDQVFVRGERIFILQLEQDIVLSTLIYRREDLNNDWYEYAEVSHRAEYISLCYQ